MQYYSINAWQLLFFHYRGKNTFDVFILDTTGYEIEYSSDNMVELDSSPSFLARTTKKKLDNSKKKGKISFDQDDDSIIELDENADVHFTNNKNSYNMEIDQCVDYKKGQIEFIDDESDDMAQEQCLDVFGSIFRTCNQSREPAIYSDKVNEERMPIIRNCGGKKAAKILSMEPTSELLVSREGKASQALRAFTSNKPFCTFYMNSTYLHKHFLIFPTDFSRKHLQGVKEVTLRVSDGRTWHVRCRSINVNVSLLKEWHEFVVDNHLGEGDVCIFELIDTSKMEMKVSIFRGLDRGYSKPFPVTAKLQSNNSSVSRKHGTRKHATSLKIERKVLAATSFSSEKPFCIVIMRPSYLSMLWLPNAFAKKHLKEGVHGITLRGINGDTWLVYCPRKEPRKVTKGWKAFVQDNHLKVNDVCIFELCEANSIELRVYIYRPT